MGSSEAEAAVENARAVANADALSSSMFAFLFASVIVLGSLLQESVIQEGRSDDVRGMFGEYVYSLVLVCISAFVALYHLVLKEPLPLVNKIATPLLAPRGQGSPQPGARRPARGDLGGVR